MALLAAVTIILWPFRPAPSPEPVISKPEVASDAKHTPPKTPAVPRVEVDSGMSRQEALSGNKFPREILEKMQLVTVRYVGFDGVVREGQIVVHKDLATEVQEIFAEIRRAKFPIGKVVPVVNYDWDDYRSMADNNTSGFNYRGQVTPRGSSKALSKHAFGRAIDINPMQNPYVAKNQKGSSGYDPSMPGTLTTDSAVVKIFLKRGWKWGGNWSGNKDYQHFEKP